MARVKKGTQKKRKTGPNHTAPTKKRGKALKRFLRKLDIMQADTLDAIQGEIDVVSSDNSLFTSYFYTTVNGPSVTFSVAEFSENGQSLRDDGAITLREDLDDRFRNANDLETDLPPTLALATKNTDKDKEEGKEMMIDVIDGINEDQPSGKKYELIFDNESVINKSAVLNFRIQRVAVVGNPLGNQAPAAQIQATTTPASPPTDSLSAANLPPQIFPSLIRPGVLAKGLGGGITQSSERKNLMADLAAYTKTITDYRKKSRKGGDDQAKFNEAIRVLEAQRLKLIQSATNYANSPGKSGGKVATVNKLIQELGGPETSSVRLKTAHVGVPFAHKLSKNLEPMNPNAVANDSTVYLAETNRPIGTTNTFMGYAKKEGVKDGQANETTFQVGIPDTNNGVGSLKESPQLVVRQVTSSRLDKALDLGLLADEIFSFDTDGVSVIGITAQANGTQAMVNTPEGNQIHKRFNFRDPEIQKNLANLTLLDALTGQGDRHMGNLFIDRATGKVTGIDNDMAFPKDKTHIISSNHSMANFEKVNGVLIYTGTVIDSETAKRINALTEEQIKAILQGQDGDPQKLEPEAIEFALQRLKAVKAQIKDLDQNGELIQNWGDASYQKAMGERVLFGKAHTNLLSRIQMKYDAAGDPEVPTKFRGL